TFPGRKGDLHAQPRHPPPPPGTPSGRSSAPWWHRRCCCAVAPVAVAGRSMLWCRAASSTRGSGRRMADHVPAVSDLPLLCITTLGGVLAWWPPGRGRGRHRSRCPACEGVAEISAELVLIA